MKCKQCKRGCAEYGQRSGNKVSRRHPPEKVNRVSKVFDACPYCAGILRKLH